MRLLLSTEQLELACLAAGVSEIPGVHVVVDLDPGTPDGRLAMSVAARSLGARRLMTVAEGDRVQLEPGLQEAIGALVEPEVRVRLTVLDAEHERTSVLCWSGGSLVSLSTVGPNRYELSREDGTALAAVLDRVPWPDAQDTRGAETSRTYALAEWHAAIWESGERALAELQVAWQTDGVIHADDFAWLTEADGSAWLVDADDESVELTATDAGQLRARAEAMLPDASAELERLPAPEALLRQGFGIS